MDGGASGCIGCKYTSISNTENLKVNKPHETQITLLLVPLIFYQTDATRKLMGMGS